MSLDDHLEKFYNYISSEKGYSQNTLDSYSNDLKLFSYFLEGQKIFFWSKVRQDDIYNYFDKINMNFEKSTIKRKHASIKSFFLFLYKEKLNKKNIFEDIRSPKISSPIPKPLMINEITSIIEFSVDTEIDYRNTCIYMLMYAAGLRVSEVIGIKLGEIDTENQTVKVTGKGKKQRILPVYKNASKKIDHYIKEIRPYFLKSESYNALLFSNIKSKPLTRQYVWKSLKQKSLDVGITKNVYPHMIRHSFATHLLEGGASIRHVQEFLGHNSIESTQIYTKIPNQKLIKDYNLAHPRGNK
jgi:integrase/recombinase XerD